MSKQNDGGPAFPVPEFFADYCKSFPGMSLRDWFAGQALMGFLSNTARPTTLAPDDANWCYAIADAMLAEREK